MAQGLGVNVLSVASPIFTEWIRGKVRQIVISNSCVDIGAQSSVHSHRVLLVTTPMGGRAAYHAVTVKIFVVHDENSYVAPDLCTQAQAHAHTLTHAQSTAHTGERESHSHTHTHIHIILALVSLSRIPVDGEPDPTLRRSSWPLRFSWAELIFLSL